MIKKIVEIKEVDLKLYGELLDNNILDVQEKGLMKKRLLPFSFKFNSSWLIKYSCINCENECNFGLDYSPEAYKFPKKSFVKTKYICSKYYNSELLDLIYKFFDKTDKIIIKNAVFISHKDSFDYDFPITSSVQLIYYNCKNCETKYLGLMRENQPYSPDRDCPEGILGEISIDEIFEAQFEKDLFEMYNS